MAQRRFYVALIYANYEEAVRTIRMVSEHGDLDRAELERRVLNRKGEAEHCSLIVTSGGTWDEAERELKARLGD